MSKNGEMVLVHLDHVTLSRYRRISDDTGRTIEDLIETAAEEAALEYARKHGMLVPVRSTWWPKIIFARRGKSARPGASG